MQRTSIKDYQRRSGHPRPDGDKTCTGSSLRCWSPVTYAAAGAFYVFRRADQVVGWTSRTSGNTLRKRRRRSFLVFILRQRKQKTNSWTRAKYMMRISKPSQTSRPHIRRGCCPRVSASGQGRQCKLSSLGGIPGWPATLPNS